MKQKDLFDKVMDKLIMTGDEIIVRELPKGKRKLIDLGHNEYEFSRPSLMSFDYSKPSIYSDLYIKNNVNGESFRLARFQTKEGTYNTDLIETVMQEFVNAAACIIKSCAVA